MNMVADNGTRGLGRALTLVSLLATLMILPSAIVQPVHAEAYQNVQVFVTTESDYRYSYMYSAYNLSGSLVATYQGPYPAAAFELPTGDYLVTVSADYQGYLCSLCQGEGASAPPSSGNGTGITDRPVMFLPIAEYGYKIVHVSGPESINIAARNVSSIPTSKVTVKAVFVNGTAVVNASVSAAIIGEWYYWWGAKEGASLWGQTDQNGVAVLTVPQAPALVTAWSWVAVPMPKSSDKTDVGGERLNVSYSWGPVYAGLSGSGALIPPQTSLSITMHTQKQDYWALPPSAGVVPGYDEATLANQSSGTPKGVSGPLSDGTEGYFVPTQLPALSLGAQTQDFQPSGAFNWMLAAIGVAAVAAVAAAVALITKKRANR